MKYLLFYIYVWYYCTQLYCFTFFLCCFVWTFFVGQRRNFWSISLLQTIFKLYFIFTSLAPSQRRSNEQVQKGVEKNSIYILYIFLHYILYTNNKQNSKMHCNAITKIYSYYVNKYMNFQWHKRRKRMNLSKAKKKS